MDPSGLFVGSVTPGTVVAWVIPGNGVGPNGAKVENSGNNVDIKTGAFVAGPVFIIIGGIVVFEIVLLAC
jgi:hypothetical protein